MLRTLTLACALALAPAASAQVSFDLITFDHVYQDKSIGGIAFHSMEALLVNTGTQPLDLTFTGPHSITTLARVHGPLQPSSTYVTMPGAFFGSALMPGEAIGSTDPLYTALLNPGETVVSSPQVHMVQFNPSPASSTSMLESYVQIGDARVLVTQRIDVGDGATGTVDFLSAKRFSSSTVPVAFEDIGGGCPLPNGPLELVPLGDGTVPHPEIVTNSSSLPAVGNPALQLLCLGPDDFAVGAPWVIAISPAPLNSSLAGCGLRLDPFAPGAVVVGGVILWEGKPGYESPSRPRASFSIPDQQNLVGLELWTQAFYGAPDAPNGMFVLSRAAHMTLANCP